MSAHRRFGAVILLVLALLMVSAIGQLARDAVAGMKPMTTMEDGHD